MKREKITPKDKKDWLEMRTQDVTSTEVSALFGLSPYLTEFELYHQKKEGLIPEFQENERMTWGSRLEKSIAEGVAEDNKWKVVPFKDYMRIPELKMGSSFDFMIEDKKALLEIKNVDAIQFKNKWEVDEDTIQAPHHIELQVQYQMLVSGVAEAYIAALVGGNQVKLIKREIDNDISKAIEEKVFQFWESIRKGKAPEPDFKRDASFINGLYKDAEPGKIIDASDDHRIIRLAQEYKRFGDQKAEADAAQRAVKAEILTIIGKAEKVRGVDFTISAGITPATRIEAFDRAEFRNFRVNWKKPKGESND